MLSPQCGGYRSTGFWVSRPSSATNKFEASLRYMEPCLKDRKKKRKESGEGSKKEEGRDWMYDLVVVIRLKTKAVILKNGGLKMAMLGTGMKTERACSWM